VVHQETQTSGSSNSTLVNTSTLVAGVADHLYLAAMSTRPRVKVSSVTGLGLTWTMLKSKCAGRNSTGIEVWWAQGEPSSDDTVKAILVSAATNAVIAVSRYSGVDAADPIGNVLAGNTNGMNGSGTCYGGVNTDSYAFDLTTTMNGSVVYGAAAMKAQTHTPGAGYTERAEIKQVGANLNTSVAVEDLHVDSATTETVNGSFSSAVDWAVVAVEIKPQSPLGKRQAIEDDESLADAPLTYQLEQNYPNPFNAQTRIRYALPETSPVRLVIYNIHGQKVRTLVDALQPAGRRQTLWNGTDDLHQAVGSGVYLIRLEAGSHKMTRRILLVK
jgi:flagellar hook assembly protein FlgD